MYDFNRMNDEGKKVRYLLKTGEILPSPWELKQQLKEKKEAEATKEEQKEAE